jgi:hypothetical protein
MKEVTAMKNSLDQGAAAGPMPQRLDRQTRAAVSFARIKDALHHAAAELKAGRCVTVWPIDAANCRLVAWDFDKQADDAHFAPTVPLELDLPAKRGASF